MSIEDVKQAVIAFNEKGIKALVEAELAAGSPITEVLQKGLIAAMDEVGERFSRGDMFVPEMLMAAQVMKQGLDVVKPLITEAETASGGTVVIGTVKGDLHDIGKNLVAMMLEGAGFKVVDLGVDVDPAAFVKAAQDNGADVVGLSALLTTTMPAMRDTVIALRSAGVSAPIMVGGAPVSLGFANEIGADGYGEDAPSAVREVRRIMAAIG